MFSADDVRRLCTTFPPAAGTPLRVVRSNSGLANLNCAQLRVSELIGLALGSSDVPHKIKVSEIAEKLDLQGGVVEQLLPWDESGWLLAEDKTIITRTGYQALCKALFSQADEEPIVITSFTKNNGISKNTFRKLVEDVNASLSSNNAEVVQDYALGFWGRHDELVYNKRYRRWLEEEVATILKAAERPKIIIGSTFQGDPPGDFLEYIANSLCETGFDGVDGHISRNCDGEIEFFPYSYIVARRDALLQDLRDGKIPLLHHTDLTGADPRIADIGRFANEQLGVNAITLKNSVASTAYIGHLARVTKSDLERRGWAHVNISDAKLDAEDTSIFLSLVRRRIEDMHDGPRIEQIPSRSDYLFLVDWVEEFHKSMDDEIYRLAQELWKKSCDLKFQWPHVHKAVGKKYLDLDTEIVRGILEQRKAGAEAAFSRHIQRFQDDALLKFSHAWKEKVLVRLQLYRIGVQNLGDIRLQEELYSTLFDHTTKTLVPEFLQKCRNKDLIKGSPLERGIEKLQQALAGIKAGMEELKDQFASTMEAIDAFTKTIRVEAWTDVELEQRKAVQLREMANNMKKDEDGPRLFLALVLVMQAAHRPGIVYSTGKYAPRLLKQLTDVMDTEKYAWMQKMKEAAKLGTMTPDEKTEIRAQAALRVGVSYGSSR
ncbi:MAG: hypothetical protein M1840_004111 [Geoglossum simile]|nr:MAG: hypothetical protein M1840_004111 [Geoglossum simile]